MYKVIRAGRQSIHFQDFLQWNYVAVFFDRINYIWKSLNEIKELISENNTELTQWQIDNRAGQIYRFLQIQKDDILISYDSEWRKYHLGRATWRFEYVDENKESYIKHSLERLWSVERDILPIAIKNQLWSISTVFSLREESWNYLLSLARNEISANQPIENIEENITNEEIKEDQEQKAKELIQDKINSLHWSEMQDLVAALLRAMGYKTEVSPPGPDGWKDVVATRDWFWFQDPTVIVEVKHRNGPMWSPVVNQLIWVLRRGQKGLFVSTWGFTRDAYSVAQQTEYHVVLINLEKLTDLVLENYENFDLEGRRLLPLAKIYWPL